MSSSLQNKLRVFTKDPFWAVMQKYRIVWRGAKRINKIFQIWARYNLEKRGYLDFLKERPPDAFRPGYADLWFLYGVVRQRKPKNILEFGSGISTVIFAQALHDNYAEDPRHKGYIYSIDAEQKWAEVTDKTIPPRLRQFSQVIFGPVQKGSYNGTTVYRHANVPDIVPDLVFLDSPAEPKGAICADVLDVEDRLAPGFYMIIDGRREMTEFLRAHMKRRYKFRYRRIFRNSVFELIK